MVVSPFSSMYFGELNHCHAAVALLSTTCLSSCADSASKSGAGAFGSGAAVEAAAWAASDVGNCRRRVCIEVCAAAGGGRTSRLRAARRMAARPAVLQRRRCSKAGFAAWPWRLLLLAWHEPPPARVLLTPLMSLPWRALWMSPLRLQPCPASVAGCARASRLQRCMP